MIGVHSLKLSLGQAKGGNKAPFGGMGCMHITKGSRGVGAP
jgi:hypothetical protein